MTTFHNFTLNKTSVELQGCLSQFWKQFQWYMCVSMCVCLLPLCLLHVCLSKHVTSAFKLYYSQIDAYHKTTYYFISTQTFWIIQNNSLPLECIKINKRKNAKQISTFNFSTLCTKIPNDKLLDILCKVVDFVFKGGTKDYIVINKQSCTSWSSKKRGHYFVFTNTLLKEAIKFLLPVFSLLEI